MILLFDYYQSAVTSHLMDFDYLVNVSQRGH